jgi:hypothetical protein
VWIKDFRAAEIKSLRGQLWIEIDKGEP